MSFLKERFLQINYLKITLLFSAIVSVNKVLTASFIIQDYCRNSSQSHHWSNYSLENEKSIEKVMAALGNGINDPQKFKNTLRIALDYWKNWTIPIRISVYCEFIGKKHKEYNGCSRQMLLLIFRSPHIPYLMRPEGQRFYYLLNQAALPQFSEPAKTSLDK